MAKVTTARTPLSRERIAKAALRLLNRHGLAVLTARRIAQALKCEPMSLYHHVANMDEIRDLVVDRLLSPLPPPLAGSADPAAEMRRFAESYRALFHEHPSAAPLFTQRLLRSKVAMARVEAMVEWGVAAGLTPRDALRAARVIVAYLNGALLAEMAWRESRDEAVADRGSPAARSGAFAKMPSARTQTEVVHDLNAGLDALLATVLADATPVAAQARSSPVRWSD